jgi:hypothetical protein
MPTNSFTTTTTTKHRVTAPVPTTGGPDCGRTAVRNRLTIPVSCDGPGPGPRAGVRVGVRSGVRLEPDPRTDTLRDLTVQVSRLTGGHGNVATNPCRGFPRGAYPEYSRPRGTGPGRTAGRGQPW